MKSTVLALLLALPLAAQDYRFESVKRTVELNDKRIANGEAAKAGDEVETGWFSYALISAEGHKAKFEIFSATEVKLASDTPGVILSVERGRIRAAFDKITGSEPRVVQTPGALLAVRGTQFDVRVNRDGETTVDVFEGVVEVQSPLQREPIFVRAGEESTHSRHRAPIARPMPEHRRREDPTRERGAEERGKDGDRGQDGKRDGGDRTRPADGRRPEPAPDHGGQRPRDGGQPRPPAPQKPPE